ncbi:MAG: hypothetical protein WCQ41_06160 [Bacillota bacterium]
MGQSIKLILIIIFGVFLLSANSYAAIFISIRSASDRRSAVKKAKGIRASEINLIDSAFAMIRKSSFGFLKNKMKKAEFTVQKAGYSSENAVFWYLFVQFILPVIILFLMFFSGREFIVSILTVAGVVLVPVIVLRGKIIERKKKFQKASYKIYKYLRSQVASGVTPLNAMKGVYQAVEDKEVSFALAAFIAKYELSRDLEQSSEELKKRFDVRETETLVVAFEQGIKTGDNSEILALQEAIMFDNYMNLLQEEHKKTGMLAFLAALMYAVGAAVILSIPMIVEMFNGFNMFFEK